MTIKEHIIILLQNKEEDKKKFWLQKIEKMSESDLKCLHILLTSTDKTEISQVILKQEMRMKDLYAELVHEAVTLKKLLLNFDEEQESKKEAKKMNSILSQLQ